MSRSARLGEQEVDLGDAGSDRKLWPGLKVCLQRLSPDLLASNQSMSAVGKLLEQEQLAGGLDPIIGAGNHEQAILRLCRAWAAVTADG